MVVRVLIALNTGQPERAVTLMRALVTSFGVTPTGVLVVGLAGIAVSVE